MPYTGTPETVTRDAVRLLVGDISTSTSGEFLANADYNYFVNNTSNTYVAAQLAANSLAALFMGSAASAGASGYVEKSVGDLKIKKSEATAIAKSYTDLGKKLGRMAAAGLRPYAGGISVSDKDDNTSDTDNVKPFFSRELFDNIGSISPLSASS